MKTVEITFKSTVSTSLFQEFLRRGLRGALFAPSGPNTNYYRLLLNKPLRALELSRAANKIDKYFSPVKSARYIHEERLLESPPMDSGEI